MIRPFLKNTVVEETVIFCVHPARVKGAQVKKDWNVNLYYERAVAENGKPSDCIKCGKCERVCPQHLPICELLTRVTAEFEQ